MNPALTIMANALRVGDHLLERLGARERAIGRRGRRACVTSASAARSWRCGAAHVSALPVTPACRCGRRVAPVTAVVGRVGMTVSDMDRAARLLHTRAAVREVESDDEVAGRSIRTAAGRVRRAHARRHASGSATSGSSSPSIWRRRAGRLPADSRGNDRWFQHVAIIVSDMDARLRRLREHGVAHASTGPQRLPDWNPAPPASRRSTSGIPTATFWRF